MGLTKIEVSKSCHSCVHGNFKTGGYGSKRKTGWCMANTSSPIIPELSDIDDILYDEAKNNSRLMPLDEFLTTVDDVVNGLRKRRNFYAYFSNFDTERCTEIWERFRLNFLWWEENRNKLRDVHVLNYCADHELAKHARSPAKGFANKNGVIDWSKK